MTGVPVINEVLKAGKLMLTESDCPTLTDERLIARNRMRYKVLQKKGRDFTKINSFTFSLISVNRQEKSSFIIEFFLV
ncbi:hypothetical protein HMF3257_01855 [Spirosoma telluris]|uniref:Uncharacterized protein n=1 Tax=Spirosoma telluris TaxID=2183553 RepID=A0A327NGQ8_9BACT|nr:hypothetical protein HMF3257_01855 [Spirosoma telluris]